jgi:hypothetical protein
MIMPAWFRSFLENEGFVQLFGKIEQLKLVAADEPEGHQ